MTIADRPPRSLARDMTSRVLTLFQQGDLAQVDPQRVNVASEVALSQLMHRCLTAIRPLEHGVAVVPDLATDLGQADEDATVWTFTLRDGLRFEDGTRLTSAEVRHGIERGFAAGNSGGGSLHRRFLLGSDTYAGPGDGPLPGIETPDELTVRFQLVEPCPDWPFLVSLPATAAVSSLARGRGARPDEVAASGPYRIANWVPGRSLVLDRNPCWEPMGDPVRSADPDEVAVLFDVPGDLIDARLVANELEDRASVMLGSALEPATVALVQSTPGAGDRLLRASTSCTRFLAVNTQRLSDLRVRRSLLHATDARAFREARGLGTAILDSSLLPPAISGRSARERPFDPERAKVLLHETGLTGWVVRVLMPDTPGNRDGMASLAASWREAGIGAEVDWVANTEFVARADRDRDQYDVIMHGWCADYPSPAAVLPPLFGSAHAGPGGANFSSYRREEVDREMARCAGMPDLEERLAAWNRLDDLIMADVPAVPLVVSTALTLHGSHVRGARIHPSYGQVDLVGISLHRP